MPMDVRAVADAGEVHPNPIVGKADHTHALRVDVSALPAAYVDSRGYLKPGVPIRRGGLPVSGAGQTLAGGGVVVEAVKVHTDNSTLAGVTRDIDVAVAQFVQVNRAILEDSIGRVLSADELSAFDAAGSNIALLF